MKLSDKLLAAIRGDTVAKADFDRIKAELDLANAKIQELQAIQPEIDADAVVEALNARILELEADNAALKAEKAELEKKVSQPSRQAAAILSRAGLETVKQNVIDTTEPKMDFPALVKAQMVNGKGKAEAIQFCVKNFPADYAEWRKGDTSKL
jgi:transposase